MRVTQLRSPMVCSILASTSFVVENCRGHLMGTRSVSMGFPARNRGKKPFEFLATRTGHLATLGQGQDAPMQRLGK